MKTLRHPVAGLVIFMILISLVLLSYNGLKEKYSFTADSDSLINGQSIGERFSELTIITSLNDTVSSIYELSAPNANTFDILGALASTGIGVLKTVTGLLIFPVQIFSIFVDYYPIPTIIVSGLILIIVIYVGFILLSAYLRSDI